MYFNFGIAPGRYCTGVFAQTFVHIFYTMDKSTYFFRFMKNIGNKKRKGCPGAALPFRFLTSDDCIRD